MQLLVNKRNGDYKMSKEQTQKIIPLNKWNDYYDYPKVGALRMLVFRNRDNFKTEVVRYVGKRQYIDIEAFFKWTEKTNIS